MIWVQNVRKGYQRKKKVAASKESVMYFLSYHKIKVWAVEKADKQPKNLIQSTTTETLGNW